MKVGTEEFKNALRSDLYVNALKVKYGYAITGHKSQGGEWNTVFVDFYGRAGLNDDCLRWCYTAITRSSAMLYATNIPHITPMSRIHILPAKVYSKLPEGAISFKSVPENKFHKESDPIFLKAKFENIRMHLSASGFIVANVRSFSYRERYTILDSSSNGYVMDGIYASSGIFKDFKIISSDKGADYLLSLVNMPDEYCIGCNYTPSCVVLEELNKRMKSVCDDNEFIILNVLEKISNYKVQYILRKGKDVFYVDFSVDKVMNITSLQVMLAYGMDLALADHTVSAFQ